MTTKEVLCSYLSVKGHKTRVERKIANLLELLHAQYSATSELHLNDRLKKLERHTHRLLDISEYLVCIKYPKARDHSEEVKEFMKTLKKCSIDVFTVLHERHAAAGPAVIAPARAAIAAPRPSLKPSASELKPSTLFHDFSTSIFRAWKERFKAYYASGLNHLLCLQQQAYLSNCLDDVLQARIDRQATPTTPIYFPIVGLFTCIKILDAAFLETYPLHVRRKQFFEARQKEGQSPQEFREELLSLVDEADGINISVNDLLCMMLQIGLSDQGLQR